MSSQHTRLRFWAWAVFAVIWPLMFLPSPVSAQDDPVTMYDELEADELESSGWNAIFRLASGLALASSDQVVGTVDGTSWTIAAQLNGQVNYLSYHSFGEEAVPEGGPRTSHDFRNTLLISELFARTPVIDEFVKSGDELDFESLYLYHLRDINWFGPYARFNLTTSIFAGEDVQAENVEYLIDRGTGVVDSVVARRLDLTDPFSPLTLHESGGLFVSPTTIPEFQVEFLLGFGSRQVFADAQLAVIDDDTTDQREVTELTSFTQAGSEASLRLFGELVEGKVVYSLLSWTMTPWINNLDASDDRGAGDLTAFEIVGNLSFFVVDWLSIDYTLRATRDPQLLDDWQIQHNLLFSVGYTFVDTRSEADREEI